MSDVNIQTFSGKVNVSNNFTVGGGHLFVDTQNNKVGLNTNTPEANLHVTGNTYISTDISVGGTLTMGTVTVEALHSLDAVTSVGNTTPHTVEFQNTQTSLVASGNVEVGGELTASGNVEVGTANLFVDTVNSRVGVGTSQPGSTLQVNGSIVGRVVTKTRTITKGQSLSGETDTFTLEIDENRIVLNNAQGSAASSREYYANFNSGVPTDIGTIMYLEINSSRTNSSAAGVNHRSEIQFNGVSVLSTGNIYIAPSNSYSKTLKRVIILTSNGWEDFTEIQHGDDGNVGIGKTAPLIDFDVGGNGENTRIGRSTTGSVHGADKRNQMRIGRFDQFEGIGDQGFLGMRLMVDTAANLGLSGQSDNQSAIQFYTWGINVANSREVMRIDSLGHIKYHQQPRFSAYSTNGNDTYSGFADPVILGLTYYNVGSHYSTSSGAFTAPVSGHYRFTLVVWNNGGSSVQGSLWYRTSSSGTWDDVAPSKLLGLSLAGDETVMSLGPGESTHTFEVYVPYGYQIGFGGRNAQSLTVYRAHSYFSGELISVA